MSLAIQDDTDYRVETGLNPCSWKYTKLQQNTHINIKADLDYYRATGEYA